jgi:hypothetical protein
MVAGCAGALFASASSEAFSPELFSFGVVPLNIRRRVYLETLRDVVEPGFWGLGMNTSALRDWAQRAQSVLSAGAS